jgi:hypothetical protein
MAIFNPTLTGETPSPTYTPTDAALASAEEMAEPVTVRDYPPIYKYLILANTILWVAYFMGYIK